MKAILVILFVLISSCSTIIPLYNIGETKLSKTGQVMMRWKTAQNVGSLIYNGKDSTFLFVSYKEVYRETTLVCLNHAKFPASSKVIELENREIKVIEITKGAIVFRIIK